MLWRVSSALSVLALGACRPAPVRTAEPPAVAAVGDAGAGKPPAIQDVEPPALAGSPNVACTFVPNEQSFFLALDGESPPFAGVHSAQGPLRVMKGPATRGALLEHGAGGLHLRGYVRAAALDLYVTRPVLFGGWLVPRHDTTLRWTEGRDDALELRLDDDQPDGRSTTVTFREPPRGVAECANVALVSPDDALDGAAFVLRGRKGKPQHVRTGVPIPIAKKPGEEPVAELRFEYADTAEVTVVERSGGIPALVVVDAWEPATLYGWIPTSVFVPPPGRMVGGRRARAPTVRYGEAVPPKTLRRVTCDAAVKILAEVAGRRAWVGELDARTPFVVVIDDRTDSFFDLELEGVAASKDARLAVERSVIEGCRKAPALVTPRR